MLKVPPQSLLLFAPVSDFKLLDEDHPPPKCLGVASLGRWPEDVAAEIPLKGMPSGFKHAWPSYTNGPKL